MKILPATPEIYSAALNNYFKRMSPMQRARVSLNHYLRAASYTIDNLTINNFAIQLPMNIYIVRNSGVEYNLPHTVDNVIVIPHNCAVTREIINHELIHIYFHYYPCPALNRFCAREGIIRINRKFIDGEIVNPDTWYQTAVRYGAQYIFIALIDMHNNNNNNLYTKHYRVYDRDPNASRAATMEEIAWYNMHLPYYQNEHPEEIIATIMSK